MLNLDGVLDFKSSKEVSNYVQIRVRHDVSLRDSEAIALYEQNYLDSAKILEICSNEFKMELFEPLPTYISQDLIRLFQDTGLVPVTNMPMARELICVYHPDIPYTIPEVPGYNRIECQPTGSPFYFKMYQQLYGNHQYLYDIPAKDLFDSITQEAVRLGTSDITIASTRKKCIVYYNIRKKKIYSRRLLSSDYVKSVIQYLFREGTQFDEGVNIPQDAACNLNDDFRGRVSCTKKYEGYMITIRVLPKEAFSDTFDTLNISANAQKFLVESFMPVQPGLHIICGATMSGKNTTILAALRQIALKDIYKIVSIERPVEQELPNVEQISAETDEEYRKQCEGLTRMNPDIVYPVEINEQSAEPVLKVTNTGKCVISTVHANGVYAILDRLEDVTHQPFDKLLINIHSVIYQVLERDEATDTIKPKLRYLRFDDDVKNKLFGKTRGEVYQIIKKLEEGDVIHEYS